jgi:ABC-type nitrate/sulfonate/bicarbonate transport system substrate-binding protein
MEDYVAENEDIVQRFRRAALRGIEWAKENPEEAVDIVMQYAPQEDRDHQQYMLETELQMALGGAERDGGIGAQTREQWQALHDYLVQHGGLPKEIHDIGWVFRSYENDSDPGGY